MLRERLVPTHVGAEDILLELGPLRLGGTQLLSLAGGLLAGAQVWGAAAALPVLLRMALPGMFILVGLVGALWTIDGRSPWVWLAIALRYVGRPRRAVWRMAPLPTPAAPRTAWQEVAPPLAWSNDPERSG
jgi:hypothetical protein